jgi:hypothetical protein
MIELTPITDPNQLTLGIESQVLTADQTQRLEEQKQRMADNDLKVRASLLRKRNLLLENGFSQDDEFKFSFEEVDDSTDVNVNSWSEERQLVTVNSRRVKGECVLLADYYDKIADVITQRKHGFDIEGNKVECYNVVGSYRKVTFRTLKEKLAEKNANARWEMMTARNSRSVLTYTVEKYQKLAPTAEVTSSRDYSKFGNKYYEFDTVIVQFENGNVLVVKPGTQPDQERVHKFVDVTTANKSAEELAQYLGR